jgi:hypothetical protein
VPKAKRALVTKEHDVRVQAYLWHASKCLLERGQEQQKASHQQFMASLVFTAFALEAYLNWLGIRVLADWEELEKRTSPQKKLKKLADYLQVEVVISKRPWLIMKDLFSFRNDIAHGKPEQLIEMKEEPIDEHLDRKLGESAPTRWQAFCTRENAERAREDVNEIAEALHLAAKGKRLKSSDGQFFGSYPFAFGMQFHKAVVQP